MRKRGLLETSDTVDDGSPVNETGSLVPAQPLPLMDRAKHVVRFVWNHPENRGRRVKAMARLLAWHVRRRVTPRPCTVDLTPGRRIRCYPDSAAAAGVLYCRLPEWEHMRFVVDFLRDGDVFVDVGANIGVYAVLASSVEGVKVYAFEPSSLSYDRAMENIELNGLIERVQLERKAVGSADGTGMVTVGLDCLNRLVPVTSTGGDVEETEVVRLDSYFDEALRQRVALVKVDVEGGEREVLAGALGLLGSVGPALIVEFNDPPALQAILGPLGYRLYVYEPNSRTLVPADPHRPKSNNLIAVRHKGAAEARLRDRIPHAAGSTA